MGQDQDPRNRYELIGRLRRLYAIPCCCWHWRCWPLCSGPRTNEAAAVPRHHYVTISVLPATNKCTYSYYLSIAAVLDALLVLLTRGSVHYPVALAVVALGAGLLRCSHMRTACVEYYRAFEDIETIQRCPFSVRSILCFHLILVP